MKRKRSNGNCPCEQIPKKLKPALANLSRRVQSPVINSYYPRVTTLRQYLVSKLPSTSKKKRRRIALLGLESRKNERDFSGSGPESVSKEIAELLDGTLVGAESGIDTTEDRGFRASQFQAYTQELADSAVGSTVNNDSSLQTEIVNFVIWSLFKKDHSSSRPQHLLCQGFQRATSRGRDGFQSSLAPGMPGVLSIFPNDGAEELKGPVWSKTLSLLGEGGDQVMMDLLCNCGIFVSVKGQAGNYWQTSGVPLSAKKPIVAGNTALRALGDEQKQLPRPPGGFKKTSRRLTDIKLVRSRMLYAQAVVDRSGGLRFGLRHIHVLNRVGKLEKEADLIHVMMYIFPREFGLHNVFSSSTDYRETSFQFKDYTMREQEISRKTSSLCTFKAISREDAYWRLMPRRLRGPVAEMVNKLRRLHQRCSYAQLLWHYCQVEAVDRLSQRDNSSRAARTESTQGRGNLQSESMETTSRLSEKSFTDLACQTSQVSAFCRAVLSRIIPNSLWGSGEEGKSNRKSLLHSVDEFVQMRRFETLSLHRTLQGLRISSMTCFRSPNSSDGDKMSKSDYRKRLDLLSELIYYLFDSFLVPLIRSNFHVTESNVHKHKLFYFRHDIWRMLTEPCLRSFKVSMFEELKQCTAKTVSQRALGVSQVRLVPKAAGARPVMNLRKRQQVEKYGRKILGASINSLMKPAFDVLKLEKTLQPQKLGSSLFSVGDIFPKLRAFRTSLHRRGQQGTKLYFAKVDVQSCFDSIPQDRLLAIVANLIESGEYSIGRHFQISPSAIYKHADKSLGQPAPFSKMVSHGNSAGKHTPFRSVVEGHYAGTKGATVFVNSVTQRTETRANVMRLLEQHVKHNIVKIGKRYYRQKTGIPQGSVVSSLLCNLFYAHLEREKLAFVGEENSLLLRLLDDFLLITTSKEQAEQFLQILHQGIAEYGVSVKLEKSMANFATYADGKAVKMPPRQDRFPYCGVSIDTSTLDIVKDAERVGIANVRNSLTIDMTRLPGQTFHRKMLNAFKIQLHAMFLDTTHNSVATVASNLLVSFWQVAHRCEGYVKAMSAREASVSRLLVKTVEALVALAFIKAKGASSRRPSAAGAHASSGRIGKRQVKGLACAAFNDVFQRRQTRYRAFLDWLRAQQRAGGMHHGIDMSELTKCLDGRGSGTARGGRKSRQRNNTGAPEQKAEVDQGGDGDSAVGKAGQRWAVGTEKV